MNTDVSTEVDVSAAALSQSVEIKYCRSGRIRLLDPGRQEKVMTPLIKREK